MQKINFLKGNAFVNQRIPADSLSPGSRSNILSKHRQNSIRPDSPDSDYSDDVKLTKDQHICIQNVGMATAFILPVALVGGAIAVGTNYWFNIAGDYVGLFRYCNNWTAECFSISGKYQNDTTMEQFWKIGVPLELTGVALLFIGMISLLCYPCHRKVNCSKVACALTIAIIMLLGMLTFVGGTVTFGIFYFKEKPDIEWSFYCNLIGAAVAFIATIMFWVHIFYTACFDLPDDD